MLVPLGLPKLTIVYNYRLRVAFNVVLFTMLGLLAFEGIYNQRWENNVQIKDDIKIDLWTPNAVETQNLAATYRHTVAQPGNVCEHPSKYDYIWDVDGKWAYTNHTCIPVCPTGTAKLDCVTGLETMTATSSSLFFATHIERTYLKDGVLKQQRHWIPIEDAFEFTLQYSFAVPDSKVKNLNNINMEKGLTGSSATNTLTVLVDIHGKVDRKIEPSLAGIDVTLQELLKLTGKPDALDQGQPELGTNKLRGAAVSSGPVGRLSGLELRMKLVCYGPHDAPRSLGVKHWNGPVCVAQAQPVTPRWVWRRSIDFREETQVMTHYHGVQVEVVQAGQMRVFDIPSLLSFLADVFVYMQFPGKLFRFILLSCLGHLSIIYSSVLNERFNLGQHAAASAVHALSSSLCFDQLAKQKDGITLRQVADTITHEFQGFKELDPHELKAFSLFFFKVVSNLGSVEFNGTAAFRAKVKEKLPSQPKLIGKTLSLLTFEKYSDDSVSGPDDGNDDDVAPVAESEDGEQLLDLRSWMTAASLTYKVQLEDLVKLFDRDRRVGVVEKCFLPGFVHDVILASETQIMQEFRQAGALENGQSVMEMTGFSRDSTNDHGNMQQDEAMQVPGFYDEHEPSVSADETQHFPLCTGLLQALFPLSSRQASCHGTRSTPQFVPNDPVADPAGDSAKDPARKPVVPL